MAKVEDDEYNKKGTPQTRKHHGHKHLPLWYNQPLKESHTNCLSSGGMLGWHSASNGHSWVLSTCLCLLLLEALVVGHLLLLFVRHVPGLYARLTRHICLLCIDGVVRDIFGRLGRNIGSVDAIFGGGFRRIQAGLTVNQQDDPCGRIYF